MPAWQTPPSFTTHTILPASALNIITSDLLFLSGIPCGQAFSGSATSIPGPGAPTQVAMPLAQFSGGMTYTSNTFTVPYAGKYLFFGQVAWVAATNAVTAFQAQLYQNGAAVATGSGNSQAASGVLLTTEVEYVLTCNANDTVALFAQHDTATAFAANGVLGGLWVSN